MSNYTLSERERRCTIVSPQEAAEEALNHG